MPVEGDGEVMYDDMKVVPELFAEEVTGCGVHGEGTYTEVEHEEDIPGTFPEANDDEAQFETEDVGEGPPSTPMVTKVDAPRSFRGDIFYLFRRSEVYLFIASLF